MAGVFSFFYEISLSRAATADRFYEGGWSRASLEPEVVDKERGEKKAKEGREGILLPGPSASGSLSVHQANSRGGIPHSTIVM